MKIYTLLKNLFVSKSKFSVVVEKYGESIEYNYYVIKYTINGIKWHTIQEVNLSFIERAEYTDRLLEMNQAIRLAKLDFNTLEKIKEYNEKLKERYAALNDGVARKREKMVKTIKIV